MHLIWKIGRFFFYITGTGYKKILPLIQGGMAVMFLNTYILLWKLSKKVF